MRTLELRAINPETQEVMGRQVFTTSMEKLRLVVVKSDIQGLSERKGLGNQLKEHFGESALIILVNPGQDIQVLEEA